MTRPILWATGTLVALAFFGTTFGTRLSEMRRSPAKPAQAQAQTQAQNTDRILVVNSDLRGHYMLHPEVDGRRVPMMVDTGATMVALTEKDADAAGVQARPGGSKRAISTANGTVFVTPVRIREMRVGDIVVRDVEAVIVPGGRLGTSLLGMSFLRQLRGFDISGGRLTLRG